MFSRSDIPFSVSLGRAASLRRFSFVLLFAQAALTIPFATKAQDFVPNYDESKVGDYVLPDPLLVNQKKITTQRDWKNERAPQIRRLFEEHVYGTFPPGPKSTRFEVLREQKQALGGKAIAQEVRVYFGGTDESMDVLIYLPKDAKKPVPVFVGLNFLGNHTVSDESWIAVTSRWVRNDASLRIEDNRANAGNRGAQASRWPLEMIIDAGYGLATAYYGDLEPDHETGWQTGIRTTLRQATETPPEAWGAVGAWGWGLSRMLDYLETNPQVDAGKVIITGHSRLGKAALWAAANDQRFAAVVSNDSGEGGAALARRNYGETVARITTSFPHWFVPKYSTYGSDPGRLPVDQHMLLALMAPRPLYVASAVDDQWADPYGEFLGAYHAGPVYALFGKKGIAEKKLPALETPVGEVVRYHIRRGKHDITAYDWEQYIAFATAQFARRTTKSKQ